jgi:hypothetical protein
MFWPAGTPAGGAYRLVASSPHLSSVHREIISEEHGSARADPSAKVKRRGMDRERSAGKLLNIWGIEV